MDELQFVIKREREREQSERVQQIISTDKLHTKLKCFIFINNRASNEYV